MSLHAACGRGDTQAAIALIDRGASVNETNQDGDTPLHAAWLMKENPTKLVRVFQPTCLLGLFLFYHVTSLSLVLFPFFLWLWLCYHEASIK